MGILQNDKTVFYHPLDDSTEFTRLQAWSGTTDYAAGKVGNALKAVVTAGGFGTETEFLSTGETSWSFAATMNDTQFVVAYQDVVDDGHGTAKIGTVSGTTITFGPETEFLSANWPSDISIAVLSATKFVIVYRDGSDDDKGKAKIGTVSGTDITFGAFTEFLSVGRARYNSVTALSDTKFVVGYEKFADSNHGTAKVGTVSGTDITFGAETEFLSADGAGYIFVAALSGTKFVVAYGDGSDSYNGKAKIGTVSGTDITFGVEEEFGNTGASFNSIAVFSGTKFVVAYMGDSNHGTAKVGTVSGTSITFGTETKFLSDGTANSIFAATINDTQFVVAYRDWADDKHGTIKIGTVDGMDITFAAEVEFVSELSGSVYNSVAVLSGTKFVVAYRDIADSDHGTAKVYILPSSASSLTGVSASYPTVISATRVAFASWLKNPSA